MRRVMKMPDYTVLALFKWLFSSISWLVLCESINKWIKVFSNSQGTGWPYLASMRRKSRVSAWAFFVISFGETARNRYKLQRQFYINIDFGENLTKSKRLLFVSIVLLSFFLPFLLLSELITNIWSLFCVRKYSLHDYY